MCLRLRLQESSSVSHVTFTLLLLVRVMCRAQSLAARKRDSRRGAGRKPVRPRCHQRNFWSTLSTQMSDLNRLLLASSP